MAGFIVRLFFLAAVASAAGPAEAAEWWYVAHDANRVLFVDQQSIRREGPVVQYWALLALHEASNPAGETKSLMRADCGRQRLGWLATAQYDRKDVQGDVSTRPDADMARPERGTLDDAQLRFVCDADYRVSNHLFAIAIDEVAFAAAIISGAPEMTDPRALHDVMAKDPAVPIIRSSAPGTGTFGKVQTVKLGEPLVPPRDYHKGPQAPRSADYDPDTVGIIYDVAYQGLKDGEISFEVRGYSGDDMVHPGSGQTESVPLGAKTITIRDLAISIVKAVPDAITYRVRIEKEQPLPLDPCASGTCEEPVAVEAGDIHPAGRSRRK